MVKLFFKLITSMAIVLIPRISCGSIDIINHSLFIDGTSGIIVSKFLLDVSEEKRLYITSLLEIQEIILNGQKVQFSRVITDNKEIMYIININESNKKFTIEAKARYDIVREINRKGIIVLSELMRTLPNLETLEQQYPESIVVFTNFPSTMKLFDGTGLKSYSDQIQRKYGVPICLGYFNLFSFNKGISKLKVIVPEGSEDIGLNIISWIGVITSFFDRMSIEFRGDVNLIYYEGTSISENILNNVIISEFYKTGENDYFRNVDSLQNFVTVVHELLHTFLPRDIKIDVIDIVEGFIQFLSIESLEYVFGNSYPKELIYSSYFTALKYISGKDNGNNTMVKYRKYPLIFRYISSLTGLVQMESLFKFLSKQSSISLAVFEKGFNDITGINFRHFRDLFDGLPVLWDISLSFLPEGVKISSTAPIDLTLLLDIYIDDTNYAVSIEVAKNGSSLVNLPSGVKSLVLNSDRVFPEDTLANNYYNFNPEPTVMRILKIVEEVFNLGQTYALRYKSSLSKKFLKDLNKILSVKKEIFKDEYVKINVEYYYRFGGDIITYFSLNTTFKSVQGIAVIGFGQWYYLKDISILN